VRCDGNQPCSRCAAASWQCTYLKTHGKSGPKGPRRTTEAAIRRLQERSKSNHEDSRSNSEASFDLGSPSSGEFPYIEPLPPVITADVDMPGWPDVVSSPFATVYKEPQRISTSCISQYLDIYQARGYGIWPVVDAEALTARLLTHQDDTEAYALATAICAAIVSQFSIDAEPGSPVEGHYRVSSATFAAEAQKARTDSDHLEHISVSSILGSFFLHVHSANVGRMNASTVFLGEAIFKAHIIGLHKASYYELMIPEVVQHHLRIYWLLFITERAHSIQHDVPTTLKRAPDLPPLENLNDGSVTPAFVQLCRLFNILDVTITADPATARSALAVAQQQLSSDEASLSLENELQRADISMTQQWMRIFLWQHALNVTSLSSKHNSNEFSFSFPAQVAQNVLSNLSGLSKASVEAHGPGMVRCPLFHTTTTKQPQANTHAGIQTLRRRKLPRRCNDNHALDERRLVLWHRPARPHPLAVASPRLVPRRQPRRHQHSAGQAHDAGAGGRVAAEAAGAEFARGRKGRVAGREGRVALQQRVQRARVAGVCAECGRPGAVSLRRVVWKWDARFVLARRGKRVDALHDTIRHGTIKDKSTHRMGTQKPTSTSCSPQQLPHGACGIRTLSSCALHRRTPRHHRRSHLYKISARPKTD
jgi:hypothetical protein